jgi:pimeloyl-ACP methyl ester carboxylesterase
MELQPTDVKGHTVQVAVGGEGPPLLYLHSAAGESFMWMDLLNGLAAHREVHAPLNPGFFGSEGAEDIHDIEDLVYHHLAFMDGRGWDTVDVMGASLGGWIALEIAARYPERVGRLVLAGSAGIRLPDVPMADMFRLQLGQEDEVRALLFHDPSHPLAELVIPTFEDVDDETLAAFVAAMAAVAKVGWNPYFHDPRLEGLLPRVTADTLVVWGREDRLIPPAYGERLAELIPGARLELIADSGHLTWFEKPAELLELALGHLGAATPAHT